MKIVYRKAFFSLVLFFPFSLKALPSFLEQGPVYNEINRRNASIFFEETSSRSDDENDPQRTSPFVSLERLQGDEAIVNPMNTITSSIPTAAEALTPSDEQREEATLLRSPSGVMEGHVVTTVDSASTPPHPAASAEALLKLRTGVGAGCRSLQERSFSVVKEKDFSQNNFAGIPAEVGLVALQKHLETVDERVMLLKEAFPNDPRLYLFLKAYQERCANMINGISDREDFSLLLKLFKTPPTEIELAQEFLPALMKGAPMLREEDDFSQELSLVALVKDYNTNIVNSLLEDPPNLPLARCYIGRLQAVFMSKQARLSGNRESQGCYDGAKEFFEKEEMALRAVLRDNRNQQSRLTTCYRNIATVSQQLGDVFLQLGEITLRLPDHREAEQEIRGTAQFLVERIHFLEYEAEALTCAMDLRDQHPESALHYEKAALSYQKAEEELRSSFALPFAGGIEEWEQYISSLAERGHSLMEQARSLTTVPQKHLEQVKKYQLEEHDFLEQSVALKQDHQQRFAACCEERAAIAGTLVDYHIQLLQASSRREREDIKRLTQAINKIENSVLPAFESYAQVMEKASEVPREDQVLITCYEHQIEVYSKVFKGELEQADKIIHYQDVDWNKASALEGLVAKAIYFFQNEANALVEKSNTNNEGVRKCYENIANACQRGGIISLRLIRAREVLTEEGDQEMFYLQSAMEATVLGEEYFNDQLGVVMTLNSEEPEASSLLLEKASRYEKAGTKALQASRSYELGNGEEACALKEAARREVADTDALR